MGEELEILVVGEGLVSRERIDAELGRSGLAYVLSFAESEPLMLDRCRIHPPDVIVVLDSEETFDAVAALSVAKEMCSDAPLIVIAEAASEEVVVEALRSGVTDYVIADRLSRLGPALERAVREREAERERLAAERAVREADASFRGVFENAPLGISIHVRGRLVMANREYLRALGYSDISEVPPDALDPTEFSSSTPHTIEGVAIRSEGSTFPYEVRIADMTLGGRDALVSFIADITERKEAEAELDHYRRDLERMVKERTDELMTANRRLQEATETRIRFLSSMSHELRTPLNSVIGFSGVLLQGMSGPLTEDQHRQLEIIYQAGLRLMDTIDDVLDVSRIEAGKAELTWEQFEVDTALKALADSMRSAAEQKGVEFVVTLPDKPLQIVCDRRKLAQIVRGLVDNAIKFTDAGHVELALELGEVNTVRIHVRDTGCGIPRDQMPYIFEEFRQVRAADGSRPEGAGLGLSICHKLTELLSGGLTARSGVGSGSDFVLALPVGPVVDLGGDTP